MFVNNFLAPIQVRLSPNFFCHTLGHKRRGDYILEGQRSRSVGEVCVLLNALLRIVNDELCEYSVLTAFMWQSTGQEPYLGQKQIYLYVFCIVCIYTIKCR